MDFEVIFLTLKLALITTFILLCIGIPLAYWLNYSSRKWKVWVETIVSLPIVLPPTVLGFYLLFFFSPENWLGKFLDQYLGIRLVFTFTGLVIGSIIYSFPFMIQSIRTGFSQIPKSYMHEALVLGKSKCVIIRRILLPSMKNSLLTGCVLTFSHTIGEFGVILMIGGNIPGETRVISIALFDEVEKLNYHTAHMYSASLLLVSFIVLFIVYSKRNNPFRKK